MTRIDYVAGFATVDVTPPVGTPLAGFAARGFHTNSGAYHPLRASAVCLGDGTEDVLIISIEILGTYEDFANIIADEVTRRTGLPRSHVMINSSHTHCGPTLVEFDKVWHGWVDEEYRRILVERLGAMAERAWSYRSPILLTHAITECSFATNRRAPDPESPGRVMCWTPYPAGAKDHDVPVLVFSDEQGKVCAVLFSYACHPTARDGLKVGGDYVGYALDAVAEAFPDAQPIFLQGCAGDQKPRASSSAEAGFGTHSLDSVRALGVELGSAVVSAVRRAEPIDGRVRANFDAVLLQNEAVDVDAVSAGLQSSERYIRRWAEKWHEELENDGENHTEMPLELQTITIGTDLALVGMGAEMTVEHGLRLKREHGDQFKTVVPLGYTNTMIGYVPVERQIDEGGYEVLDANQYWGYSGPFVRDSEDRIHSKIGAMISELVD